MKKLLFIKTAVDFEIGNHPHGPPLGLMYLAAFIREKSPYRYDIKLFDMRLSRTSIFDINRIILEFKPDIIGCSVLTMENKCLHAIAKLAKESNNKIKTIVGGPHPTIYYQEILKDENIDIAVIGEGEETLWELLKYLEEEKDIINVIGIAFRRGKEIIFTGQRKYIENLDILPFPAWDLVDIDRYSKFNSVIMNMILAGRKYMFIFTSRGCPYKCIYCHNIFAIVVFPKKLWDFSSLIYNHDNNKSAIHPIISSQIIALKHFLIQKL